MLPPLSTPAQWPSGYSHLCAKCGELTPGLAVGGICPACRHRIALRARRLSRWIAMGTTLPLAAYVTWVLPRDPTARLVAVGSVLAWYLLTSLIARRVAMEWLS